MINSLVHNQYSNGLGLGLLQDFPRPELNNAVYVGPTAQCLLSIGSLSFEEKQLNTSLREVYLLFVSPNFEILDFFQVEVFLSNDVALDFIVGKSNLRIIVGKSSCRSGCVGFICYIGHSIVEYEFNMSSQQYLSLEI